MSPAAKISPTPDRVHAMRRLLLHIGPHKTGTSSFQIWLRDNAVALRKAGIAFPVDLVRPNGNGSPLARIMITAPHDHSPTDIAKLDGFRQFCAQNAEHSVILSAESVSMLLRTDQVFSDTQTIDPAHSEIQDSSARHLQQFVFSLGFDQVDLLALIRDPVASLTSKYTQRLKKFKKRQDFSAQNVHEFHEKHFVNGLEFVETLGFQAHVAPYHTPDDPRPLSARLVDLAGLSDWLDDRVSYETPHANIGPGWLQCIGLGHLHFLLLRDHSDLDFRARRFLNRALVEVTNSLSMENDEPLVLFASNVAKKLRNRVFKNLDGIERYSGGKTADDFAQTFADERPQSPLSYRALDTHQRSRLDDWLHRLADQIQSSDTLKNAFAPHNVRNINASPHGVHSAPLASATCLGGVWAAPMTQ